MNLGKRKIYQAVVLALSVMTASTAMAQTVIGGGSSLAGPLIQIPYIVTPVTISYVNGPRASTDTFRGPQTTPGQPAWH